MYWLRRIPAETRIVVLVVFLALLQAILLSVFGLLAIRGERKEAQRRIDGEARQFLIHNVSGRTLHALRDVADAALTAAFDDGRSDWRDALAPVDAPLFTDAFVASTDGGVRSAGGELLWVPASRFGPHQQAMDEALARLRQDFRKSAISRDEKSDRDLALAEQFPFARDADGGSLALLLAASPLPIVGARKPPTIETLLTIRWICVLNRLSGYAPSHEVTRLLHLVESAVASDQRDAFAAEQKRQERRARVLDVLVRELPSIPGRGSNGMRRNVVSVDGPSFYLRYRRGERHLLAVDSLALGAFLRRQLQFATAESDAEITPRLVARAVRRDEAIPAVAMEGIPGWSVIAESTNRRALEGPQGRERMYWYIIGFSVLGILAGGVLTARVVSREVRLAKLKSGFVSNVSHGLKTPLTSIRMFSDMLRNGHVDSEEEQRECLDVIAQETNRLERLIQQVLDFGRLEARRRPFQWRTASLAPLVEREVERFRRATGMATDAIDIQVAVNLPAATFDPDAFTEVVANLMSNAFKYSPPQDRRLAVTLGPSRGRVVFAVEDNGRGVPPRERRKIFEQFYRVDDLLAQEVEGTGLGLAIVRGIVRAHGGRIYVEDSALGGSRFVVEIPAAPRQRKAAASAETS